MTELSAEEVFRDIGPVTASFTLSDMRSIGRTRGGDLHPTAFGTSLWFGTFTVRPHRYRTMEQVEARMETLLQTDATFLLCPASRGAATRTTGTVSFISSADRRIIRITGSSQVEGDFIGIFYDSGRRGLHRVGAVEGSDIILTTPLARSASVGDALTFGRPNIRAVVDRDGYNAPLYNASHADGLSVSWTQTLGRAS